MTSGPSEMHSVVCPLDQKSGVVVSADAELLSSYEPVTAPLCSYVSLVVIQSNNSITELVEREDVHLKLFNKF